MLLLALSASAVPLLTAAWGRRRGKQAPAWAVTIQCLAVAMLALALTAPRLTGVGRSRLPWLALSDVSASTRVQSDTPLVLPEGTPVAHLDFAADLAQAGSVSDKTATNLAGPLRLAAAGIADRRFAGVVIRTDGQFTDDDWQAAARSLHQAGGPVAIVPLDSPPRDARLVDFTASRAGDDTVALSVTTSANSPGRRTLTVRRDSPAPQILLTRPLELLPGDVMTIRLDDHVAPASSAGYTAQLSAGDKFPENDEILTMILPRSQRVLYIWQGAALLSLAGHTELPVDSLAPADAPQTEVGLADYAAVILIDPAGDLLVPAQREAIARYVRSGGGLVLVGSGPRSSPADRDDPLNQVAALIANAYERTPLAVTVVLDASGSMAQPVQGQTPFLRASQAVLALRRYLTPQDSLQVITFSEEPLVTYDSNDGPADFSLLDQALRRVEPAGPTHAGPALTLAAAQSPQPRRRRLIILVSDLMTQPFDQSAAAHAVRHANASLAVVAIGSASQDPGAALLAALAAAVDAPLVRLQPDADLSKLAELFGRFIRRNRGSDIRRDAFGPLDLSSLPGAAGLALPPPDAYIPSAANGPDVEVYAEIDGDPILALRRAGLGRSASLALPLAGEDNLPFRQSPRAAELLTLLVDWSLRPAGDPRFIGQVTQDQGQILLAIDAAEQGVPINGLELTAAMLAPSGERITRPMQQVAPGGYELRLPAARQATSLQVARADGTVIWRQAVVARCPREFDAIGPAWHNLRLLAQLTAGRLAAPGQVVLSEQLLPRDEVSLSPALLTAGLALMLIEWAAARPRRAAA